MGEIRYFVQQMDADFTNDSSKWLDAHRRVSGCTALHRAYSFHPVLRLGYPTG